MPNRKPDDQTEKVDLLRGGQVISTLTGAFGNSLRETRLTAVLGYLIAQNSKPFLDLFGFKGLAQQVSVETRHKTGRSDILIETNLGTGIVEAKVNAIDPIKQATNYPAKWRALLTHHKPPKSERHNVRYVTWEKLSHLLQIQAQTGSPEFRVVSKDLLGYLTVHHMTKKQASVEIYAREINEPITLELFLKARLYGCIYKTGSKLGEALYFAPHFGKSISKKLPGISVGISYVARIEAVGQATNWKQFQQLMKEERGQTWLRQNGELLKRLKRKWTWNDKHRSFVLLGSPRLAFNPPVLKENLQSGKGWLSNHYYSFEDLLNAWGR